MAAPSPLFLSEEELIELTGRKIRKLQIEELKRMLISFRINAIGKPVVTREAVIGNTLVTSTSGWTSRAISGR